MAAGPSGSANGSMSRVRGFAMTAIWHRDGSAWRALAPAGFADEKALHDLVAEAPHLLPLAGSPRLVVLGREVQVAPNAWADLLAVESTGRLAVIEIKLAKSSEARRAVVAQVLAYAAFLHGSTRETLERDVLGKHLTDAGFDSITQAATDGDQDGTLDTESFDAALSESLATGRFRLVLVLDEAPPDLVRLVSYLQTTAELVIDLVTVASFRVGDQTVLVPQRIEPVRDQRHLSPPPSSPPKPDKSHVIDGADEFAGAASLLDGEDRQRAEQILAWARELEATALAKLSTTVGVRFTGLNVRIPGDTAIATAWIDKDVYLQLWRSVLLRRAPEEIEAIERLIGGGVSQGASVRLLTLELFEALTAAYRLAAGLSAVPTPAGVAAQS
jgi:hypothetical protein